MINIDGIIILLILAAGFAGLIVLQVHLSKKEAAMPSLILPILSLVSAMFIALMFVLNMAVTDSGSSSYVEVVSGSEVYIEEIIEEPQDEIAESSDIGISIIGFVIVFAMNLVPCIVYTLIFFACHPNKKKRDELQKMSINDL